MRVFDWFMAGAVAMLYTDLANDEQLRSGRTERFDATRDTTYGVLLVVEGEWVINWPFIFSTISAICFLIALWKVGNQKMSTKKGQPT